MRVPEEVIRSMPSHVWRPGVVRGASGNQILWAPIGKLASSRFQTGFSQAGEWVAECAEGVAPLEEQRAWCLLLSILERSPKSAQETLRASLKHLPHGDIIAGVFPFAEIVAWGLSSGDYWAGLALDWIGELNFSRPELVIDALRSLIQDKDNTYAATRERAERVLTELSHVWHEHRA